jgi:hypothetical protein
MMHLYLVLWFVAHELRAAQARKARWRVAR